MQLTINIIDEDGQRHGKSKRAEASLVGDTLGSQNLESWARFEDARKSRTERRFRRRMRIAAGGDDLRNSGFGPIQNDALGPQMKDATHPSIVRSCGLIVGLTACLSFACGDDEGSPAPNPDGGGAPADGGTLGDGGSLDDAGTSTDAGGLCEAPVSPPCQDESAQVLRLRDEPSPRAIVEEGSTAGERTFVDATAGGTDALESFVYARFTESGLEKLDLSDEEAFEDPSWHIAFRRYVIRLNSGVSGPSCVGAARLPDGTDFENLTQADSSLAFGEERYLTDSCELVNDGSGFPDAAATLLSSYWDYPGCLRMTDNVFVLQLPDARAVKLQVLSYYEPERQEECDMSGTVSQPSGSANIRLRWAFLAP